MGKHSPLNRVLHGDCLDILHSMPRKSVDVIITDPPWPNADPSFAFTEDAQAFFNSLAKEAARVTNRFVVIVGCDTDPRFFARVPEALPFFRRIWLKRIPPVYRGSLLYNADIAYVFGHRGLNGVTGVRCVGGEVTAVHRKAEIDMAMGGKMKHPTPRFMEHMLYLVKHLTKATDVVVDPCCGSGTTLVAAQRLGRRFIGIEVNRRYCMVAREHLRRERSFGLQQDIKELR